MVSREATLVDGALTVDHGKLDAAARQLFISSAANRQFLMNQALSLLTPSLRAGWGHHRRLAGVPAVPGHGEPDHGQRRQRAGPGERKAWESAAGACLAASRKPRASMPRNWRR